MSHDIGVQLYWLTYDRGLGGNGEQYLRGGP